MYYGVSQQKKVTNRLKSRSALLFGLIVVAAADLCRLLYYGVRHAVYDMVQAL